MKQARIWDLPIRIFHWLLPVLIIFSWYSAENHRLDWHRYSGYGLMGLLFFRLFWGVWGTYSARFTSFVRGPATLHRYLKGEPPEQTELSHNPIGGWSIVAMLLVLGLQIATGLFAVDVDGLESGPLAYLVSFDGGRLLADIHELSFNVLLGLIALHLAAVLWYDVIRKQRLLPAMVHGRRPLQSALPNGFYVGRYRLLATLCLSAILVWLISSGLRF